MAVDVVIPQVGESVQEAILAEWFKEDGDSVAKDEALFVIETDKVTLEVVAEVAGKLSISVPAGETVTVGAVVATIDPSAQAPGPNLRRLLPSKHRSRNHRPNRRPRPLWPRLPHRLRRPIPLRLSPPHRNQPPRVTLQPCPPLCRPRCAGWLPRSNWISAAFRAPVRRGASPREMCCSTWSRPRQVCLKPALRPQSWRPKCPRPRCASP
jgi:pyruvate/2-oxoglutarate dehydrogenase complex dihydrolipoamide acyltransferase (E2) component